MKVLIISANTVPSAPSGPAYVAGAALESGYAVAGDRLARLSLNTVGLGKREWSVFGLCRGAGPGGNRVLQAGWCQGS